MVVVVSVFVSVFVAGVEAVVMVFVSLVLCVWAAGFTIVVLFSTFFSAAGVEAAGVTTSVLCSHAPRRAAPAKMQSNFFIVWIDGPCWG